MEKKIINRCPKCSSEKLRYGVDIFSMKDTGKVSCDKCKSDFTKKDMVREVWIPFREHTNLIEKIKKLIYNTENRPIEFADTLNKIKEIIEIRRL